MPPSPNPKATARRSSTTRPEIAEEPELGQFLPPQPGARQPGRT